MGFALFFDASFAGCRGNVFWILREELGRFWGGFRLFGMVR